MLGTLAVAAVVEAFAPRRPEPDNQKYRWTNNLGLVAINQLCVNWVTPLAAVLVAWWTEGNEFGLFYRFDIGFWPKVLIAISTLEFIGYTFHRALHRFPWLWRIHAIHHSDTELDFTTVYRSHPLELVIIVPITVPVIVLLGFPLAAVIIYQLLRTVISIVAHSNIYIPDLIDRILRCFIVTPDFHRMHHSSDRQFTDSNFGAAFPWYDYLFGTASKQAFDAHPTMEIGLSYFRDPIDSRIDRLLLMPFSWRRRENDDAALPSVKSQQVGISRN